MKGIDMKLRLGFLVVAALSAPLAHVNGFSYVGALDPENSNDAAIPLVAVGHRAGRRPAPASRCGTP